MDSDLIPKDNQEDFNPLEAGDSKPVETGTAPLAQNTSGNAGLEGDISKEDILFPYMQVVAKTGNLSDEFTPGHIVFNKEVELSDGKTPLIVTPLRLKKGWVEDTDFDSEVAPRRFSTLEEAVSEGFSEQYGMAKRVVPEAYVLFLVPVDEEYATIEAPHHLLSDGTERAKQVFGGQPKFGFARAMYICKGSAYNAVAKPLITAACSGHLRGGLHTGSFSLTTYIKTYHKNSWWCPKMKSAGKHDPEFIQWLEKEVIL